MSDRPTIRPTRSRGRAIWEQRCPRCLEGKVFSGAVTMREHCPACGHRFQREPGYFLGAMYVSYPLAIVVLGVFIVLIHWLRPDWPWELDLALAVLPLLVLVPTIFRYSRILWMHFDTPLD
jgi:uncharacterized protein (DUF983 family)